MRRDIFGRARHLRCSGYSRASERRRARKPHARYKISSTHLWARIVRGVRKRRRGGWHRMRERPEAIYRSHERGIRFANKGKHRRRRRARLFNEARPSLISRPTSRDYARSPQFVRPFSPPAATFASPLPQPNAAQLPSRPPRRRDSLDVKAYGLRTRSQIHIRKECYAVGEQRLLHGIRGHPQ